MDSGTRTGQALIKILDTRLYARLNRDLRGTSPSWKRSSYERSARQDRSRSHYRPGHARHAYRLCHYGNVFPEGQRRRSASLNVPFPFLPVNHLVRRAIVFLGCNRCVYEEVADHNGEAFVLLWLNRRTRKIDFDGSCLPI